MPKAESRLIFRSNYLHPSHVVKHVSSDGHKQGTCSEVDEVPFPQGRMLAPETSSTKDLFQGSEKLRKPRVTRPFKNLTF
jgi:hypothetical protein